MVEPLFVACCREFLGRELSLAASGICFAAGPGSVPADAAAGSSAASCAGASYASGAAVVVVALLSSFGVELAVSMFFSPLTMDGPLGASVSPDPDASAASSSAFALAGALPPRIDR